MQRKKQRRSKKQEWTSNKPADEVIESSDDEDGVNDSKEQQPADDETVVDKRTRLAKELLTRVQSQVRKDKRTRGEESDDDSTGENELVERALRKEVLQAEGKLVQKFASNLATRVQAEPVQRTSYRSSHSQSVTTVKLSHDETKCFSGSKDGHIVGWDVQQDMPFWKPTKPTKSCVVSLDCSTDGRYLASCGDKKGSKIRIWDVRDKGLDPIRTLIGHRDTVTGVCFRKGTHTLLSASSDRSVRIWNAAEGSFVEDLFGHYSRVCALDCLSRERCITCSEDMTVRLWKIPEETHLMLSGSHFMSIDCVKMLNELTFVSGSQDGTLGFWHVSKKKPVDLVPNAHGQGHWIEAVATLHYSDLIATGSDDGLIRVWQVNVDKLKVDHVPIAMLPCEGHVNALDFSTSGRLLACGVGQEHRFGRWRVTDKTKNRVNIFRLPVGEEE